MITFCLTDKLNLIQNCCPADALSTGENRSSLSCSYQKLFKKWPDAFYFESDNTSNLVKSMKNRCLAVIDSNGERIKD